MAILPTKGAGGRSRGVDALLAYYAALIYGDSKPVGRPSTPAERSERGERKAQTPGLSGFGSQQPGWAQHEETLAAQADLEDGARRNAQLTFGQTTTDQRPPLNLELPDGQRAKGSVEATRQRRIPRSPIGRGALLGAPDEASGEKRTRTPLKLGTADGVLHRAQGFGALSGSVIAQ